MRARPLAGESPQVNEEHIVPVWHGSPDGDPPSSATIGNSGHSFRMRYGNLNVSLI